MSTENDFIRESYLEMTDAEIGERLGLSAKAVKNRRHRMQLFKDDSINFQNEDAQRLMDDLGLALEDVGRVERVNVTRRQVEKQKGDAAPETDQTTTTTVLLTPTFNEPEWPVVQPAKPVVVRPPKVKKVQRDIKVAALLPDPQIGFRFNSQTGEFDPFHDMRAINIALQVIRELLPDEIINLGDYLDFPQFGRYIQEPGFANTTQITLDEGHRILGLQRAASPHSKIIVLEGNHDIRLIKYIIANAKAAFGITRANDPESWPVLSVPFLLRFDELDVEYVDGYPAAEYEINERLICAHGSTTGQRGRTAAKLFQEAGVSVINGHNHHAEIVHRTVKSRKGPITSFSAFLGTLARIDGAVPSYHSGMTNRGTAVKKYEDWQQGFGILYYEDDPDGLKQLVHVPIHEGKALFQGKVYEAGES